MTMNDAIQGGTLSARLWLTQGENPGKGLTGISSFIH